MASESSRWPRAAVGAVRTVLRHDAQHGAARRPGDYLGTDRDGAIEEIVAQIAARQPDVVGLCEMFSDGEREFVRNKLRLIYPHFREGPDEADLESDGSLLLLSRHPILFSRDTIYRDCDGSDCFANKGILHMRLQPPSWPTPLDVFYTHMQNIATSDGVSALYAQLDHANQFMGLHGAPNVPKIMMGDLNIPAADSHHYEQLIIRLRGPRDCWTVAGNSIASGDTSVTDSNFYEDEDDRPPRNERLDYVLLKAEHRAIPILSSIEVLKFPAQRSVHLRPFRRPRQVRQDRTRGSLRSSGRRGGQLLAGHEHVDVVLRVEQVGVVVFAGLELDPVDLAGEGAGLHVEVGVRWCRFRSRRRRPRRPRRRTAGSPRRGLLDLLAVVVEGDGAALGVAAAVVGELHADLVGAGRDELGCLGGEGLDAEQVAGELGVTVGGVEAPAADGTALGEDRPVQGPSLLTTSAVTENDLFLMFRTLFSDSRVIPG